MASANEETRTDSPARSIISPIEDVAGRLLSIAGALYADEERKRRMAATERSIARARGVIA
jgi:hypothetical protein